MGSPQLLSYGRFRANQRAGATLTVLVMVGMLIGTSVLGVLSAQDKRFHITIDSVEVTFGRRLSGDGVGQHEVPPFTLVNVEITATVSAPVDNAVLIDYFPSDWTVVDANGGIIGEENQNYKRIEWNIGILSSSVSKTYTLKSPREPTSLTVYYFHSELSYNQANSGSDDWKVVLTPQLVGVIENVGAVPAGQRGVAAFASPWMFIVEVTILPKYDVPDLEISVEESDVKPATIPPPPGKNHTCFADIRTTIPNSDIEKASIKFKMSRDWLAQNNVDEGDISLLRFHGDTWHVLPTSKIESDSDFVYYRAITPGFSTFTQTTTADFEAGTKVQVDVSNDEIKLADFKKTKWMLGYVELADGENTKYVAWDDNALAWSDEANAYQLTGGDEIWWVRAVSGRARADENSKNEKILAVHYEEYGASENRAAFMVWDGSAWGNSFENEISDPNQYEWRPFDVAYEENSGRAMAAYAVGASVYYRIWDGSAWSAEAEVGGIGTTGTIEWVTLAPASSVDDGLVTNDNTPTLDWDSVTDTSNAADGTASGVKYYELWVDNDSDFSSPEVCDNSATNSYTTAELADENYSYKVRVWDEAGNLGEFSVTWTFLIDTVPPAAAALVSPENNATVSTGTPTFKWTTVTDPSGVTYELQIDNEASFSSPYVYYKTGITENQHTSENALASGDYYWRVRAVDQAHNVGPWADNFIVSVAVAPPGKPTLLKPANGENLNDNTPTIEWTAGSNADNHRLLVDNDNDFSSPKENRVFTTENTYTPALENSLVEGVWYWKVIAKNAAGENESDVWKFRVDITKPAAPTLVSPADGAETDDDTPMLDWNPVDDNSKPVTYDLQLDDDSAFGSPAVDETGLTATEYTTLSLPDGIYHWRVRARDNAGNVGDWSEAWALKIKTLVPPPPTPYFTLSISPSRIEVQQGSSATVTITSTSEHGYAEWVSFDMAALLGTEVSFVPSGGMPSFTSMLRITVNPEIATGEYSMRIKGVGADGKERSRTLTLVVVPASRLIDVIEAGGSATADFTPNRLFITSVTITVRKDVENARIRNAQISIEEFIRKPERVPIPSEPVYRYFGMVTTNLAPTDISSTLVEFKVLRSWIERDEIDENTIKLLRWSDNGWQELSTRFLRSEDDYLHFEAQMPGLSLFAAVGERRVAPPPPTVRMGLPWLPFVILSIIGIGVGGIAAYIWMRPSKYYLMLKRLERAVVGPRRRRVGKPRIRPPVRVRKRVSRAELAALRRLERIMRERKRKFARERPKESAGKKRKQEKSAGKGRKKSARNPWP